MGVAVKLLGALGGGGGAGVVAYTEIYDKS